MQFSNQHHKTVKFHRNVQPFRPQKHSRGIKTKCSGHSDILGNEERSELYVGIGDNNTDTAMARFNFAFTDVSHSSVYLFVGRDGGGGRYDCPPLLKFHRHPVLPATYTWASMAISSLRQQQIIRHGRNITPTPLFPKKKKTVVYETFSTYNQRRVITHTLVPQLHAQVTVYRNCSSAGVSVKECAIHSFYFPHLVTISNSIFRLKLRNYVVCKYTIQSLARNYKGKLICWMLGNSKARNVKSC